MYYIFVRTPKLHCGGIFGTFWASLTRQSFFKNRAPSVFLNYDSLTSSIKSRDTDELFLRFFLGNGQNRRRNGQTNGRPAKYTGHFCQRWCPIIWKHRMVFRLCIFFFIFSFPEVMWLFLHFMQNKRVFTNDN